MSNQLLLAVEGESLISKEKPSISELTPSFDGLWLGLHKSEVLSNASPFYTEWTVWTEWQAV